MISAVTEVLREIRDSLRPTPHEQVLAERKARAVSIAATRAMAERAYVNAGGERHQHHAVMLAALPLEAFELPDIKYGGSVTVYGHEYEGGVEVAYDPRATQRVMQERFGLTYEEAREVKRKHEVADQKAREEVARRVKEREEQRRTNGGLPV
ncbi:hypothetical protein CDO52_13140 [Nocardiopsis gilva YIM 90087]|uniref:Uncharacterized protein n=1 Tax=Nocardiopsis gilva YIM 90087 TaxID=1235441 RepID=A0A223S680_9ACTN|nr:hypothetical protein [Nocardiopsis gilva]ASU83612.1 hypothetical protein CDO52_13140 [Nocardiopsis gilva YIM 90087]